MRDEVSKGSSWFDEARFGMFVHWGPYSVRGWEPSWPLVGGIRCFPCCQDLTVAEYHAGLAAFDPPVGAPREWMRLARRCGMRYAVLTAKHHDRFALFPSAHAAYGVAPGRDLVGEFVAAARDEELRVGLYFSLPDWHHPAYPAWRDDMRPYAFVANPRSAPAQWQRFLADLRGQVVDLLGRYGPIDVLWFDGGWERTPEAALDPLVTVLEVRERNSPPDSSL
jgi:alpha-L-fucosidase